MPCITMLIHSSEIAVELKLRNAKLKRIKTRIMRSYGLETHCPAKILHSAAIFAACAMRSPSQKTAGSHFLPGGHFETAYQLAENRRFARIGSQSREPIIAK